MTRGSLTAASGNDPPLHQLVHGDQLAGSSSSHKTSRIKQFLAKKRKQNHPISQWVQMKTGNKIRSKRRPWGRTRLRLQGVTPDAATH
ncbi:putative ribosomal protein eL39-like 5 [Crocuta crocuta]